VQQVRQPSVVLLKKNTETRFSALSRPLPEDQALFNEVDLVLTEIRRCYAELDKFWAEEISRAFEALRTRQVDPTDFERWKNFHANIKQTVESWKVHDCFFLCCALPTDQTICFRTIYPVVMLNPYTAAIHATFVYLPFHFGTYLD
jgi:hypothetical protein